MVAEQPNDPTSFTFPTSSSTIEPISPRRLPACTNVNSTNCQRTVLQGVQHVLAAYQEVYRTDRPPYIQPPSQRRRPHPFYRTPEDHLVDELAYERDPNDLNTSFYRFFYLPPHPRNIRTNTQEESDAIYRQYRELRAYNLRNYPQWPPINLRGAFSPQFGKSSCCSFALAQPWQVNNTPLCRFPCNCETL